MTYDHKKPRRPISEYQTIDSMLEKLYSEQNTLSLNTNYLTHFASFPSNISHFIE